MNKMEAPQNGNSIIRWEIRYVYTDVPGAKEKKRRKKKIIW